MKKKDFTNRELLNRIEELYNDNDYGYKFEKMIINSANKTDMQLIYINVNYEKKLWYVSKDYGETLGKIDFVFCAKTGNFLENEYFLDQLNENELDEPQRTPQELIIKKEENILITIILVLAIVLISVIVYLKYLRK